MSLQEMDPRFSFKSYPRVDNAYKLHQSLNYDLIRHKIFEQRPQTWKNEVLMYCALMLIGLSTGFICSLVFLLQNFLSDYISDITMDIIGGPNNNMSPAWGFNMSVCLMLAFIAAFFTSYWCPNSVGSGLPQFIGVLNGVNLPGLFGVPILIMKSFGCVIAICSGLIIGKEGPLAHVGSICAMYTVHLIPGFVIFHDDVLKRQLIAAGMAAGLSCAFGAPIGATFLVYELSTPNTFWKLSLIWKVLFTSVVSILTFSIFTTLYKGDYEIDTSAWFSFTSLYLKVRYEESPSIAFFIPAVILGLVCGLLSGLQIRVHNWLQLFRKFYIRSRWQQVVEVILFSASTTTVFFWTPYFFADQCIPISNIGKRGEQFARQYNCPDGEYSPLASLFMATQGQILQGLMSGFQPSWGSGGNGIELNMPHLWMFFFIYFMFTITTFGVSVPSGWSFPALVTGCTLGAIYEATRIYLMAETMDEYTITPLIVGSAAMLSGSLHLTYSVVILSVEMSSQPQMIFPLVVAVGISNFVAKLFSMSFFHRTIRQLQIPLIRETAPELTADLKAEQIMSKDLITLPSIADMKSIKKALTSTHQAFPVLNMNGNLVGIISKVFLLPLCEEKKFYERRRMSIVKKQTEKISSINEATLEDQLIQKHDEMLRTNQKFSIDYDEKGMGFLPTQKENILEWTTFRPNFHSEEPDCTKVLEEIVDNYPDEMIDLRPYFWQQPFVVSANDPLKKCLEIFQSHHLRHLPVVLPSNGMCVGVITRKDLFEYMSL